MSEAVLRERFCESMSIVGYELPTFTKRSESHRCNSSIASGPPPGAIDYGESTEKSDMNGRSAHAENRRVTDAT